MKATSAVAYCLLALSTFGCNSPQIVNPPTINSHFNSIIIFDQFTNFAYPKDSAFIETTWVSSDIMTLIVQYAGGCKTHMFALYVPAGFLETYPVQVRVFLSHDARGDQCKAIRRDTLYFSLLPLKREYEHSYPESYQYPATIDLQVFGPNQQQSRFSLISYHFYR